MEFKEILKFEGVMTRKEWWMNSLMLYVGTLGAYLIAFIIGAIAPLLGALVFMVLLVAPSYVQIAFNKARANDAGWNGWVQIVPILNLVVIGFFETVKKPKKRAKKKK